MKSKDWRPTAFVETAPGVVAEQEADASRLQQRRSLLAFLRHLMTLGTASLVLAVTLLDKALAQPQKRLAVGVAVGALLISVAAGGIAHLVLLANGPRAEGPRPASSDRRIALLATTPTLVAFLIGVAALAWFFFANGVR